jgi:hypothetical protein
MNEEFVNTYIEMNNKKIEELIRSEVLFQTRLAIAEKAINKLTEEKQKLVEAAETDRNYYMEVIKDNNEKNNEIIEENKKLIVEKKKLNEEIKALQDAVMLISENQKTKK